MTMIELVDFHYNYSELLHDAILPETIEERTDTACNAQPACKRGCNKFETGDIIGRDQEPSCLCTHSRAIHRKPNTDKKKAARR